MNRFLMAGILIFLFLSCKEKDLKTKKVDIPANVENKTNKVKLIAIALPREYEMFPRNGAVFFQLENERDSLKIDSMAVYFNNVYKETVHGSFENYQLSLKGEKLGVHQIKLVAFSGNMEQSLRRRIHIRSEITPKYNKVKIVNTYKHDPKAYTQGLQYEGGWMYEGTGQYAASSLRKVDLKTGEVKQYLGLENKYFGEGITIMKDKIIQLTWDSNIGFIYDKETFSKLASFSYPSEGWGITYNGEHLIMSDGSNKLRFMDTDVFTEVKTIEVYDDFQVIKNLNELEFINGYIYANVWQTNKIVVIDPENGRVMETIDCSILVPEKYIGHIDNVLNGIAYNKETGNLYLTGKYWDVLYEVKVLK